jgi:ABC-type branched-subunit amino acid transport system ATPase component
MLSVRDLDLYYGDAQALSGVSLEVPEGELVALVGANGAGKSSLIRALAGMVPRDGTDINSSLNAVQTMLARKQRSLWKVELFQNTPARLDGRPEDVAAMTQELQAAVNAQL